MKKTLLLKFALVLLLPVMFYFLMTGFWLTNPLGKETAESSSDANGMKAVNFLPTTNNGTSGFENVIYNWNVGDMENATDRWLVSETQISRYSGELHYTGVHQYDHVTSNLSTDGTDFYGKFAIPLDDPPNTQQTQHNIELSDATNLQGLKLYSERCKISELCYAERLVYMITPPPGNKAENYGFCYQHTEGEYMPDQGKKVLHATPNEQLYPNGYMMANGIYENLQHQMVGFGLLDGGKGTWYIKPMMRIPLNVPDETPVVRITVTNYSNQLVDTILIKAKHFKDDNNQYGGQYKDNYHWMRPGALQVLGGNSKPHDPPQLNDGGHGFWLSSDDDSHVDFSVYWLGQVEVWFEKTTVDDERANILFDPLNNFDNKIDDELSHTSQLGFTYFADEITFSQVPCVEYVMTKIKQYNQDHFSNIQFVCAQNNIMTVCGMHNKTSLYNMFLNVVKPDAFSTDLVDMISPDAQCPVVLPDGVFTNLDPRVPNRWFKSKDDYNAFVQFALFGDRNSMTDICEWLSDPYKWKKPSPMGTTVYNIEHVHEQITEYSPETKLIYEGQMQGYLGVLDDGQFRDGSREPTNEEISAQACVAISHGVQSLFWFIYQSPEWNVTPDMQNFRYNSNSNGSEIIRQWVCLGLLEPNSAERRMTNCYGQPKWEFISALNAKIFNWKTTLDQITWQEGYSVHSENANHNFISNIQSIDPSKSGYNQGCFTDGTEWLDCPEERYWEMGFFNPAVTGDAKYLMMVNRRCIPQGGSYAGDNRVLRLAFNSGSFLPKYSTWKIYDITKPIDTYYFLRTYQGNLDIGNTPNTAGYFLPGEGKLFKLEPVPTGGGTLLADETIPGTDEITFTDTLFTNGFNLTIEEGAKLHFTDSACIVVDGGVFTAGDLNYQGQDEITFDNADGNTFHGLYFNNAEVRIYHSQFSGLANDTTYAVNTIDCPVVDIRQSSFTAGSNTLNGAVNISCLDRQDYNIYIGGNTFEAGISNIPFVNIIAYAEVSAPALVENNTFNSTTGASALMLSGITGGAVKTNNFYNFTRSISALSSSIDLKENTISASQSGSVGIEALTGTELRLNKVLGTFIGGLNTISNTGTYSKNLYTDYSYYFLSSGENVLNVLDNTCNHLKGDFPPAAPIGTSDATVNCFKIDNAVSTPVKDVLNQGQQVSFTFEPYLTGCIPGDGGDMLVINLGDGIYDTLTMQQGAGGMSSNAVTALHTVYDSVCIQMRHRNYRYVKDRCQYILNAYPDSIYSIYAISKLYQSVSITDTTSAGKTELKTFLESLILNHPNNTALVKRANYFVQKCKVLLKQYTSALAGFQQIINSNPYSYEALVAHWDYMATSLLMNGGAGGQLMSNLSYSPSTPLRTGMKNWLDIEFDEFDKSDESDNFNGDPTNTPFSKEEKKQIKQTIKDIQITAREQSVKTIEALTKQAESGNIELKKIVKQMRAIEEQVKLQRPGNITEHIQIVKEDLKKVFGADNQPGNNINNSVPVVFSLSQNYPNPFNPTTKINYDLPKDCKVTITIYDILGREVIKLVNEFKKAGRYTAEFNGNNLASGVYFYRIEAREFVQSKKMVLVK